MLKCKICDCAFHAISKKHYVSRENGKIGIKTVFEGGQEVTLYDTYDCPACGCQVIAQERKRKYNETN